jgi:hypothetical protein
MRNLYTQITKDATSDLPLIPFALHELVAMESIIEGYTRYLATFPSCPQREGRLEVLKNVKGRLQAQLYTLQPGTSLQMALKPEEIAELLTAMVGFIEQVKRSFTENNERDMVVNTVNCWRLRLITVRSELQA